MGNFTNTDCIKCGSETAYFDGWCFVCPECGHEWERRKNSDDE